MEFTIARDFFVPFLERACALKKNTKESFEQVGHLSIKAADEQITLFTSNGYIECLQAIKNENLKIKKEGECVVDSISLRNIVKSVESGEMVKIKQNGKKSQ